MKKITLSILAFAASLTMAMAQAPAKFNYQGIARNASGAPLASKTLGMRLTVHDATAGGTIVYQETQTATTNSYGLYNVAIGAGTPVTGTLAGVNWSSGNKYIQVEIDVNGGTSYADLGSSQLLSVPYAMYSAGAPAPTLTLTGSTLSAGGNSVTLPAGNTYTAGTGITISGSNAISVNNLSGDVTGAPNATTVAKIQGTGVATTAPTSGQTLTYNGTNWAPATPATYTAGTGISITGGAIAVNNLAGDVTGAPNTNTVAKIQGTSVSTTAPTSNQVLKYNGTSWAPGTDNDAQSLSISGTTLSLTNGGSVTIPTTSYTAGTGLTLSGTTFSANNTSPIWNANQIQSASVSSTAPASGQALVYTGGAWTPTTLASGTVYTGGTGITVSGGGVISANNLAGDVTGAPNANTVTKIQGTGVSTTAPTSNQVLKYNGTNWAPGTDVDNDAQTLSLSGSTLSISNGNSVTLPAGNTYTAGTGVSISGTNVISVNNLAGDVNGAPNANTVSKIQGTSVSATAPTNGQTLTYNGTNWAPATPTTYTAGTGISITGGTIATSSLGGDVTGTLTANTVGKIQGTSVSATAPTSNQVLKYNGTNWAPGADADAQTLSLSGSSLSISGGNSVTLPTGTTYTAGTGISISGSNVISTSSLAGDVTGSLAANTVGKIQGVSVSTTAPTNGQALVYNGTNWAPGTISTSGVSGTQYYLPKFATATSLGNSSIYETSAGRVGINTIAPQARVQVTNTADTIGMYVSSTYNGSGSFNVALLGENTSTNTATPIPVGTWGWAVPSLSASPAAGKGVIGEGGNVGVQGIGYSTNTTTGGAVFGVYGISYTNADAVGTYGQANAYSSTGGTKYGVYGVAANGTTNWAGYFGGNVQITGSISKGSGTFKIDHPLDPANKYLYHSFVESPDMMNIYNGNVVTDANGYATVTMPSYFDALNKDFRYQLTVIGTFAQAIVKEEMNGNTFVIQTSQPNVKVSWQVTGVRQDAYANAHRVQPEVEKEAENKGKYLHPVELGKPATTEINYELNHPKMFSEDEAAKKQALHKDMH